MNYSKIYTNLLLRAKNRKIKGYTESHHIKPKCIGGTDEKDNLVKLTAREHFIAHLLLSKIYPEETGLVLAIQMMCVSSNSHSNERINNRMYSWLKEKLSKSLKNHKNQSGEKNSQFGTMWIHNLELKESKKIKKDEFSSWEQDGWIKGRINKELKKIEKENKKNLKLVIRNEKLLKTKELYTEYYKIYSEVGFQKFVEVTTYEYSQENLVSLFSRHVE